MNTEFIWHDTDNMVKITGLRNAVTGAWINNATVALTVYDSDGNAVAGATGLAGAYIAGSNGNYQVVIPSTVTLTDGALYDVEVTITGAGFTTVYRLQRTAAYKRQ